MPFNRCLVCMRESAPGGRVCSYCHAAIPCPPNPEDCLQPGCVLPRNGGRYVIGRAIGRGGFGISYIAFDTRLQAVRCIKEYFPKSCRRREDMSPDVAPGEEERFKRYSDRFLQEARIMSDLSAKNVPNVAVVYDQLEENGTNYIVMEYLNGCTMDEYIRKHGGLRWEEAKKVMTALLQTLSAIHRYGYLHRDVSLNNIFYLTEGGVRLIDYGCAEPIDKARNHPELAYPSRKLYYSPPEQVRREAQGEGTDVYAAGMCMYKLVAGGFPEGQGNGQNLPLLSGSDRSVPPAYDVVIRKAVRQEAGKRYPTAAAMLEDVRKISMPAVKPPVQPKPRPIPTEPASRSGRKSAWVRGIVLCAVLALAGAVLYVILHPSVKIPSRKPEPAATSARETAMNAYLWQTPSSVLSAAPLPAQTAASAPLPTSYIISYQPAATPVPNPIATPIPERWITAASTPMAPVPDYRQTAAPAPNQELSRTAAPANTPETKTARSAAELGLHYHRVQGGIEITDYTGIIADLVIPETLDGYTVVSIGKQAFDCGNPNQPRNPVLTSIVFPDTVRTIGESAFSHNKLLRSVTLPRYLTEIADDAFSWCVGVAEFDLPSTLTRIGNYAFDHCSSLQSISIPDGVTRIGYTAFAFCSNLKSVRLPPYLISIQNYLFTDCVSLERVELPSTITRIGVHAFFNCASLVSVNIPASVSEILDGAFDGCSKLTATVKSGSYAEKYCVRNRISYTLGN